MTDESEDAAGDRDAPPDGGGAADGASDAGTDADVVDDANATVDPGDDAEAAADPGDDAEAAADADAATDAEPAVGSGATDGVTPREAQPSGQDDDSGSFLGNLTSPRKQLGEAAAAFKNARGTGSLPTDEEDRVKLVCRRHAERRAVPLDDLGRPACYDAGHPDCEGCLEDVRDGTVETW